jgi:hypothetical protein
VFINGAWAFPKEAAKAPANSDVCFKMVQYPKRAPKNERDIKKRDVTTVEGLSCIELWIRVVSGSVDDNVLQRRVFFISFALLRSFG